MRRDALVEHRFMVEARNRRDRQRRVERHTIELDGQDAPEGIERA
jgi:hypothetical protein